MGSDDLTIKILQGIRDDLQKSNADSNERFRELRTEMNARFEQVNDRFEQVNDRFDQANQRFEIIETSLRDMAEQLVMLARGVKTALEIRANVDRRMDDYESRLAVLEKGH
jgi:methyl-accepting chemotaxis protein